MWFKDANVVICSHWCNFIVWCLYFEMIYFINDLLLNPCWMMKRRWSVWWNSGWLLKWLWNVDRVLDECWNNDENVNVLKWLVWGGYIIVLRWMLNRLWDVDSAIKNLSCWRMVVWVLRRTYCCILLSVNMTNGCMSILKDLLL